MGVSIGGYFCFPIECKSTEIACILSGIERSDSDALASIYAALDSVDRQVSLSGTIESTVVGNE